MQKQNDEIEMVDAIDMLMDDECSDNITLIDEDGKEVEFEQYATIPMDDTVYAILKPVVPFEDEEQPIDTAYVFEIFEGDDENEPELNIITDQDIVDKVFKEYDRLLSEMNKEEK